MRCYRFPAGAVKGENNDKSAFQRRTKEKSMQLLLLVSDFAQVAHVQRPEEGVGTPGSLLPDADRPLTRGTPGSRLGRMIESIRAAQHRIVHRGPGAS